MSVVTGCASCHNGTSATGKTSSHIATTAACETCHKSTTIWTGAKADHSTFTTATICSSCHNGSSATGKDANHVSTTLNCTSCHKSYTSWTPAKFHANVTVVTGCLTCHNAYIATGKNSNHISTTAGCETCHKSTTTFLGAKADHSTFTVATNCASCHNASKATGKPTNHIPESQLLAGSSMTCMGCHTSTTSWTTMKMNHNGSQGNGAGWCKSCHATGTAYLGSMDKKALAHKAAKGASPTDCSLSGCHKPLGSKGAAYTKWD